MQVMIHHISDFKECWVELGRVMAQNAEDMTSPTCMVLDGKLSCSFCPPGLLSLFLHSHTTTACSASSTFTISSAISTST